MNQPSLPVITELPTPPQRQEVGGSVSSQPPHDVSELTVECVWLDWHDRRKARQRVSSDAGTELCLSLPRGTVLTDGQVLYCDSNRYLIVRAKPEPLIAISPKTIQESCRVAHHLGNWHRPVQIDPDSRIWVERDRPVLEWLERSGIPFEILEAPFQPNSIARAHHH